MIMMHTHTTGVRGSLLCFCIHKGTFEKQIQEINVNMKEIKPETNCNTWYSCLIFSFSMKLRVVTLDNSLAQT